MAEKQSMSTSPQGTLDEVLTNLEKLMPDDIAQVMLQLKEGIKGLDEEFGRYLKGKGYSDEEISKIKEMIYKFLEISRITGRLPAYIMVYSSRSTSGDMSRDLAGLLGIGRRDYNYQRVSTGYFRGILANLAMNLNSKDVALSILNFDDRRVREYLEESTNFNMGGLVTAIRNSGVKREDEELREIVEWYFTRYAELFSTPTRNYVDKTINSAVALLNYVLYGLINMKIGKFAKELSDFMSTSSQYSAVKESSSKEGEKGIR